MNGGWGYLLDAVEDLAARKDDDVGVSRGIFATPPLFPLCVDPALTAVRGLRALVAGLATCPATSALILRRCAPLVPSGALWTSIVF